MDGVFRTEVEMFKCHVCGSEKGEEKFVNEVFEIGGEFVLVENIPALVCARCGEAVFSRETTERVRKLVHEKRRPLKSVRLNVFSYA
jgi:YgiT-type zinc finger domain-containing protein